MSLSFQPLVSIVTPVYNAESYLDECVRSVLAQSYDNWDYTIINNCSTDRSLEIAFSHASKDKRIRVYSNVRHLSIVANLNFALSQISPASKYCKFVLADDWIFPDCLTRMVEVAEANPTVGIVGSYRLDDVWVTCDGLPYPSTFLSGREICRLQLLTGLFVFGSPNSLLIRSDLVRERNPFYNDKSLHEDTEVCYQILRDWDFGFVHQVLTFTRRDNASISSLGRQFYPNSLDKYIIVKKYGSAYLAPNEFHACLKQIEGRYYRTLAKGLLSAKWKEFWAYHKSGLETVGEQIKMITLIKYFFLEFVNLLLNPKKTLGRFI